MNFDSIIVLDVHVIKEKKERIMICIMTKFIIITRVKSGLVIIVNFLYT